LPSSLAAGTTAAPLWEQPSLPNVHLHPAEARAAPLPIQVLPTQVLQVSEAALVSFTNKPAL